MSSYSKRIILITILLSALFLIILGSLSIKEKGTREEAQKQLKIIEQKILDSGDNRIHGFIYSHNYLWASTRTSPCRILKINPSTLEYERITLDYGLDDCEDIVSTQENIWAILYTSPSRIVKVNPNTLEWEIAITFKPEEIQYGGSLEYAFGYLWAGGYGKVAKINIENLDYRIFDYTDVVGTNQFHGLTSGGGYIYASSPKGKESIILRIDPNKPNEYEEIKLSTFITDDLAYSDNALYVCSESMPSYLYKINEDLNYNIIEAADTICYGTFRDKEGNIWGAYAGNPGKFSITSPDLMSKKTYELPHGYNNANEIAFDEFGNIYITCWESPAKIVKIRFVK